MFRDRISRLDKKTRAKLFGGAMLDDELDPRLQQIVESASNATNSPIALVSMVLDSIQFFRAHIGLPSVLEQTRATDRDVSFCQFVVAEGRIFEVNHASTDERVPQDLVKRFGIEAYLGVPVTAGSDVVGSLCVIDTHPRKFSVEERAAVTNLAKSASERLLELKVQRRSAANLAEVAARGAGPAFAELNNQLTGVLGHAEVAQLALADLRPLARLRDLTPSEKLKALEGLVDASDALARAEDCIRDCVSSATALAVTARAMQRATISGSEEPTLSSVIEAASIMARHHTKLVGDIEWTPVPSGVALSGPRLVIVSTLSLMLSLVAHAVADASGSALHGTTEFGNGAWSIKVSGDRLDSASYQKVASELDDLLSDTWFLQVETSDHFVAIVIAQAVPEDDGGTLNAPESENVQEDKTSEQLC